MNSDQIKKGSEHAPHRSLLRAVGVKTDDFKKPFIGVCNSFTEIIPGHVHLNKVADFIKKEIRKAGGVPIEFNTIGICDEREPEILAGGVRVVRWCCAEMVYEK